MIGQGRKGRRRGGRSKGEEQGEDEECKEKGVYPFYRRISYKRSQLREVLIQTNEGLFSPSFSSSSQKVKVEVEVSTEGWGF